MSSQQAVWAADGCIMSRSPSTRFEQSLCIDVRNRLQATGVADLGCEVGLQANDFGIVPSSAGHDLPGQPLHGRTLEQCKAACSAAGNCVAFSWRVVKAATETSDCFLKSGGLAGPFIAGPTLFGKNLYTTYIMAGNACREFSDEIIDANAAHATCCADTIWHPALSCTAGRQQECCHKCRRRRGKRAAACNCA